MTSSKLAVYRDLFANSHEWLEGTMADVTPEQAAWQPDGNAVPAGAHYIHHLVGEDLFVQQILQGKTPLMAGDYAGKAGFDAPPPMGPWADWARSVAVDLDAAREYARAVYAATDDYLANAGEGELERELDLTEMGWSKVKASYLLNQILTDVAAHCGEISCIKGLQGLKGYPF